MFLYEGRGIHGTVVEGLGGRIVTGKFVPGEILDLTQLEHEFGVSKTVMREALKVLSAKGLVEARQRLGTFVTERDRWHLLDPNVLLWEMSTRDTSDMLAMLSEVRSIIEPQAAALAAHRHTDADITAMSKALGQMDSTSKSEAIAGDIAFHRALMGASQNDILQRVGLLVESLMSARGHLVHESTTISSALHLHTDLFDSVKAGDSRQAQDRAAHLISRALTDEHLALPSTSAARRKETPES